MARLAECPTIVGVKDAVGDLAETTVLIEWLGPEFIVLSGDDAMTLPLMSIGAHGVISVLANILPETVKQQVTAAARGDFDTARSIHNQTRRLTEALFCESNPIPVKTALALLGKVEEQFRLPLCPINQTHREKLITEMKRAGLLTDEGRPVVGEEE
jgi:4-hydroxy-tetrahydrodipicolinate synthase